MRPYYGLVHKGETVADGIENGFAVNEVLLLLVIVAELYVAPEFNISVIIFMLTEDCF